MEKTLKIQAGLRGVTSKNMSRLSLDLFKIEIYDETGDNKTGYVTGDELLEFLEKYEYTIIDKKNN